MTRDSDTRRMAETGTGSVRSTGSAVPNGQSPNSNVIPSSDLDALVEALRHAADWGEDEFDVLSPQDAAKAATAITPLRNQLTASEARERELRDALSDPNAVHTNMLRGTIAKPSIAQILHIYGSDAFAKELSIRGFALTNTENKSGQ